MTLPPPQFLGPTPAASLFGPFGPTTCDGYRYTVRNQRDLSAEVRLACKSDGAFSWSGGGSYLHIDRHYGTAINEDDGVGATRSLYNAARHAEPYLAGSRQSLPVERLCRLRLARLQGDHGAHLLRGVALRSRGAACRSALAQRDRSGDGRSDEPRLRGRRDRAEEQHYAQLQPKLAVNFKPSQDLTLFADWGLGFKAGGFNSQGSAAIIQRNLNVPLASNVLINDDYRKQAIQRLRGRGTAVVLGASERAAGGRTCYNASIFIDRDGALLGCHRKLKPAYAECYIWGQGDGSDLLVVDSAVGRLGALACWEHTIYLPREVRLPRRQCGGQGGGADRRALRRRARIGLGGR